MKKKRQLWASIVAGILAAALLLGLIAIAVPHAHAESSSEIKARIEKMEEEKEVIEARIEELEGQIDSNMDEMEAIVAQKDLIDQEVFLLNQQITTINNQISDYGLLIADKQDALDEAQTHLTNLQEKNQERIRAMEKNGSLSYWSVIFKANSFVDLLDRLKMIEEIAQADKDRLEEMNRAAEAVALAKEELETEKASLEESKTQLNDAQAELEVKRVEASELLGQLHAKGEEFELLLEESEEEQAKLAQDIAQAEEDYEDAKDREWAAAHPQTPGGVTVAPPVSGEGWMVPIRYTAFTSPFGYREHPVSGGWRMHYGVDLAAPTGTPIYASRSGTVTTASYQAGGAGSYVNINHGDGYSSIYMHMTHYIVSVGQYVDRGQVIGYCGSTGASTGPHLHFGIAYNGSYVNPANYISI